MSRPKNRFLVLSFVLALGFAGAAAAQENQEKIKVLIVTGFDAGAHKWRDTTQQTTAILEGAGKFDVKVSEDVGIFESSSLDNYDVVVLNYGFWSQPEPSDEAKEAILNYVKSGKGLVSLHFSCSSFQEWDEYRELLGRVWVKGTGGHGPRGQFSVKIDKPDHPVTTGLSEFTTDDELYAKLSGDAEIEVLASAYSDWSKKVEPIVFVKPYGKGRVVHNVLGHDTRARENPVFQTLLIRGVEWASTGKAAAK
jgi:type 1 glutamine amidotransferase